MKSVNIRLTKKQYRSFFTGNVHQGFKDFIKDEKKLSMFYEFRNANYDRYSKAELFPGIAKAIKKIHGNYILSIASSGKQKNILQLLNKNGLDKFLAIVLATTENTKENMINEIVKRFGIKPKETVMVTDTVGDINIAKKMGLKTIAVTWGFHPKKLLSLTVPDKIVSDRSKLSIDISSIF